MLARFSSFFTQRGEPGSVRELLALSIPLIISQAATSLMLLTDRLVLSWLNGIYAASSMLGGFTLTLIQIFFLGILGYVTPLTAQYWGAGQVKQCPLVLGQGLILALGAYPCMLFVGFIFAPPYFAFIGIHEVEAYWALKYYHVILLGSLLALLNTTMGAFCTGIGQTKAVMQANLIGLVANIGLTLVCCLRPTPWWLPIEGAAIATNISMGLTFLYYVYIWQKLKRDLFKEKVNRLLSWNQPIFAKLIRYGLPTGIEMFLSFTAFALFGSLFHSYGPSEALAMTITLNWDIIAFMFLWGIGFGVSSQVGKAMGAGDIALAVKSTRAGVKLASSVSLGFIALYWLCPHILTEAFLQGELEPTLLVKVRQLTPMLLRFASFYTIGLAASIIFASALRAAGDTKAYMWIQNTSDLSMLLWTTLSIKFFHWSPLVSWSIFVGHILFMGLWAYLRFQRGHWQKLKVV